MLFARSLLVVFAVGGALAQIRFVPLSCAAQFPEGGLTILACTVVFPLNARTLSLPSLRTPSPTVSTRAVSSRFSCRETAVLSSRPSIPG